MLSIPLLYGHMRTLGIVLILFGVTGCASTVTIQAPCDRPQSAERCLGEIDVPADQVEKVSRAAENAISVAFSEDFRWAVVWYMNEKLTPEEAATAEWSGLTPDDLVGAVRRSLPGMEIETYGGLWGWWINKVFGNIAKDGTAGGPIRLNRIPLRERDYQSVTSSIIHEAAHKGGLRHDSSDIDCDPPYVLDALAEALSRTDNWKWNANHCETLRGISVNEMRMAL